MIEMASGDLNVERQHRRQDLVEGGRDLPRQPALTAGGALLHWDTQDHGHAAVPFGHLGSADGLTIGSVAAFAPHGRRSR